ncbi:MAG TPA: amidohydrolase [Candidatus Limnocylindria bacterium]|nr:amidohydrolase [Candidatus Limnocylindria bacterium]
MKPVKPTLVLVGQVVVAADATGLETAEALAIGGGRVLAVGGRREIVEAAGGARVVSADGATIVPGLHDFHLHLVGMARARRIVDLSGASTMNEVVERLSPTVARLGAGDWVRGDGWSSEALDRRQLHRLEDLLAGRPALLRSHDHHSAWASFAAREVAGVGETTLDPAGGRIERGADGAPDGVLRERAVDLVADRAPRLSGDALAVALVEVAQELVALGVTGATDAGDSSTAGGYGRFAELGDSFSSLADAGDALGGRLRLNVDLPAAGLAAAAGLELTAGSPVTEDGLLRVGWAKVYADGALGSRTAALFDPYRCEGASDVRETGILRVSTDELDALLGEAAAAGIGLAIHAIGDRAVATVLDAIAHRKSDAAGGPHRIEHAQLVRVADRPRFAELGVTASLQPIHLPGDRAMAELCWGDRLGEAYPWRSLASVGALLAFGSDAPIETANPWLGIHAAVRRCLPGERPPAWGRDEALDLPAALGAYTLGPARAAHRADLGHLRPGARADLAVLNTDLRTMLAADERLASIRSRLTLVEGREVHAE